jgi:hypothetical protein
VDGAGVNEKYPTPLILQEPTPTVDRIIRRHLDRLKGPQPAIEPECTGRAGDPYTTFGIHEDLLKVSLDVESRGLPAVETLDES